MSRWCRSEVNRSVFPCLAAADVRAADDCMSASGGPPGRWSVVGRRAVDLAMRKGQNGPPAASAGRPRPAWPYNAGAAGDGPPRPRPVQQRIGELGCLLPALSYPVRQGGAPPPPTFDLPIAAGARRPVHGALPALSPKLAADRECDVMERAALPSLIGDLRSWTRGTAALRQERTSSPRRVADARKVANFRLPLNRFYDAGCSCVLQPRRSLPYARR